MNRDERIARGAGDPPEIHQPNDTTCMYPSDGAGGTWIAANECGITLSLLNWNGLAPNGSVAAKMRSRGRVIPGLINSRSASELREASGISNFEGVLPFRLVGVFASEREIWEWRWDSTQLASRAHEWKLQHWFSSSLSDEQSASLRGAACRDALHELDAGSALWLRRLHASHAAGPGPFSLCVHRDDVETLSYTEVTVTPAHIQMGHSRGTPCTTGQIHSIEIERSGRPVSAVTGVPSLGI